MPSEMSEGNHSDVRGYRGLRVYEKSFELSLEIHRMTLNFPEFERYELGKQLRRAAVSIPANIAEGYGKKDSVKDFKRFLRISLGSCNEVLVYLDMVYILGYIEMESCKTLSDSYEVLGKQLYRMIERWQ